MITWQLNNIAFDINLEIDNNKTLDVMGWTDMEAFESLYTVDSKESISIRLSVLRASASMCLFYKIGTSFRWLVWLVCYWSDRVLYLWWKIFRFPALCTFRIELNWGCKAWFGLVWQIPYVIIIIIIIIMIIIVIIIIIIIIIMIIIVIIIIIIIISCLVWFHLGQVELSICYKINRSCLSSDS